MNVLKNHHTNNQSYDSKGDLDELNPSSADVELLDSLLLSGETIVGHGVFSNHVTWKVLLIVIQLFVVVQASPVLPDSGGHLLIVLARLDFVAVGVDVQAVYGFIRLAAYSVE